MKQSSDHILAMCPIGNLLHDCGASSPWLVVRSLSHFGLHFCVVHDRYVLHISVSSGKSSWLTQREIDRTILHLPYPSFEIIQCQVAHLISKRIEIHVWVCLADTWGLANN